MRRNRRIPPLMPSESAKERVSEDALAKLEAEENAWSAATNATPSPVEEEKFNTEQQITRLNAKVEEMERQVSDVLRMRRASLEDRPLRITVTDADREEAIAIIRKQRSIENARREDKRPMDLMRMFGTIFRQITQHRWAWPFMQPVDVEGLQLPDYFQIIKKPMDFGTIREKMDAKGYRDVHEIAEDVRLVFTNAMTYNEKGSDVYMMAKVLSESFEGKWKAKLQEWEARRQLELDVSEAEEAKAAEAIAIERMAHDACEQLNYVEDELEDLKVQATSKCRPMSMKEKRQLFHNLAQLPPPSVDQVIQIVAKKNPGLNDAGNELELDINAQDTGTLWQLHCYVQMVLNRHKQAAEGAHQ